MRTTAIVLVSLSIVNVGAQRAAPSHGASPGAVREVARVNGVPLMSDRLDAAVNRLMPYESFHRSVSGEKVAAIRAKALQTIVDDELQYQAGVRAAVTVSAAEVEAAAAKVKTVASVSPVALRREIRRSLTIQKLQARTVASKCRVNREEAARFFAANPDRFVVPEQLHVFAITIGVDPSAKAAAWADARARAEDVRLKIQRGASFADMARTYSTDPSKTTGGDMGFVHRGSLNDEFERVLRDLAPNQTSDVVQTLYGYHIVRLTEIRAPQRKTFAEVAAQIENDLTSQRCADLQQAWLTRLRAEASIVVAGPAS
jgi:peptidyl-prolyl cis-trans isomerase C